MNDLNRANNAAEKVTAYENFLKGEERSRGTIEKYLRDVREFTEWLGSRALDKESALEWKSILVDKGLRPTTVNSKLAALNGFFGFIERDDCRVKFLKLQRQMFKNREKELTAAEYHQLVECAYNRGQERLALLLETLGATGIRVSELKYISVNAAQKGRVEISLKGKIRTILMPSKLCRKLLKYAKNKKIVSGEIFVTRNGVSISRKQVWAEMKALCAKAGISGSKVYPHNLRHMFAAAYYKISKDIVKVADVLGHSSVETTRIYLLTTGAEHIQSLERLDFVI